MTDNLRRRVEAPFPRITCTRGWVGSADTSVDSPDPGWTGRVQILAAIAERLRGVADLVHGSRHAFDLPVDLLAKL
jgi:hypothetical protein